MLQPLLVQLQPFVSTAETFLETELNRKLLILKLATLDFLEYFVSLLHGFNYS